MSYTTRDLFWLTLLVAVAVAWWLDRRAIIQHYEFKREMNSMVREAFSGPIRFRWKWPTDPTSHSE